MALSLLWLLVRGKVWHTLLQEKATYGQTFFTICEGYLLNNFLPLRLGEVARAFLLAGKATLSFWQVSSTILIERALDVAFAAGLLLGTLPFVIGASWARRTAIGSVGLVLAGLILLYLLARYREQAMGLFEKMTARWPFLQKIGGSILPAFFTGLGVLTDGKRFLRVIGWMVINWIVGLGEFFVILLAFFPDTRLLWSSFGLGATALGIAVPSSPGALGVFEATMVGALSLFGLNASVVLAYAITTHFMSYLFSGILGIYALAKDGETLTGLYRRVRNIQPKENV